MDIEHIKEDLSICYLKTIAAINGIALEQNNHDEDSSDVVIKKFLTLRSGRRFNSQISVQLKATSSPTQCTIGKDEVTYKLKVKNYNDLCAESAMPCILGLLVLPTDREDWVYWGKDELMLRGQMYWLSLQDKPTSNNLDSVSVKIPRTNRLSKDSIEGLLIKAAEEGKL